LTQQNLNPRLIKGLQLAIALIFVATPGLLYLFSFGFRAEVHQLWQILSQGDLVRFSAYLRAFGIWAPIVSILLMIAQALLAPIPTFLIGIVNGLVFGVFWGATLSLIGSVLAAGLCFWIARLFGGEAIAHLVSRVGLEAADRWFAKWGAYAVLGARLIPGLSFDAISYAAGLTQIVFWKFIGATAIGVVPQAFLYAYLGQQAPQYIGVFLAIALLIAITVGTLMVWRHKFSK
jgi:uncharacterized membrane protein YdjX (TVP38/TMEM64 family)